MNPPPMHPLLPRTDQDTAGAGALTLSGVGKQLQVLMSQGSREQQKTLSSPLGHWLLVTVGDRGEGSRGQHQGAPGPCSWPGPGSYPAPSLAQGSPARGRGSSRCRVTGTQWGQWFPQVLSISWGWKQSWGHSRTCTPKDLPSAKPWSLTTF